MIYSTPTLCIIFFAWFLRLLSKICHSVASLCLSLTRNSNNLSGYIFCTFNCFFSHYSKHISVYTEHWVPSSSGYSDHTVLVLNLETQLTLEGRISLLKLVLIFCLTSVDSATCWEQTVQHVINDKLTMHFINSFFCLLRINLMGI